MFIQGNLCSSNKYTKSGLTNFVQKMISPPTVGHIYTECINIYLKNAWSFEFFFFFTDTVYRKYFHEIKWTFIIVNMFKKNAEWTTASLFYFFVKKKVLLICLNSQRWYVLAKLNTQILFLYPSKPFVFFFLRCCLCWCSYSLGPTF